MLVCISMSGKSLHPKGAHVGVKNAAEVLNLCANNYLGLAQHPAGQSRSSARAAMTGVMEWPRCALSAAPRVFTNSLRKSSVNFSAAKRRILYPSCFDANAGLFETLLSAEDAVISDELNHASIIDGVRLCQGSALPLPQLRYG